MYTLHLRDAKTRKRPSVPDDRDALSGRLQLYMYFTLLKNLIAREPSFDFNSLWSKLDVNPAAKLPSKFLVQAQLISNNEDFGLVSLNDLVASFYKLIDDATMHVSPLLELVYYLRTSDNNREGKGSEKDVTQKEFLDSLKAAAANCKRDGAVPNEAGTSRRLDMGPSEQPPLARSKQSIHSQFSGCNFVCRC
jgi:hypothetical protein